MKFKIYKDWAELPKGSDTLYFAAIKESVFLSREWFEAVTPHLINQHQSLLLLCVVDEISVDTYFEGVNPSKGSKPAEGSQSADGSILAILPVLTNSNREWTSFTHPYSALFSILLADENQADILKCLCEGIKNLDFDYLTLAPVVMGNNKLINLQKAMKAEGLDCYQHNKAYNWLHKTHRQSFDEYFAERPSKVRNTIQRKQRKLARKHKYDIQLFIDENIDHALDIYHDLYKVSWKANEQHQLLVNTAVKRFANNGWPRLAILTIAEKPIAAQLWFVVEGKASIFRLVYNQAWKDYSPGSILMTYLLEHVIDKDKVTEIDFLSGNDKYKQDWMSERRERNAIVFVNKTDQIDKPKRLFSKVMRFIKKSE